MFMRNQGIITWKFLIIMICLVIITINYYRY